MNASCLEFRYSCEIMIELERLGDCVSITVRIVRVPSCLEEATAV